MRKFKFSLPIIFSIAFGAIPLAVLTFDRIFLFGTGGLFSIAIIPYNPFSILVPELVKVLNYDQYFLFAVCAIVLEYAFIGLIIGFIANFLTRHFKSGKTEKVLK